MLRPSFSTFQLHRGWTGSHFNTMISFVWIRNTCLWYSFVYGCVQVTHTGRRWHCVMCQNQTRDLFSSHTHTHNLNPNKEHHTAALPCYFAPALSRKIWNQSISTRFNDQWEKTSMIAWGPYQSLLLFLRLLSAVRPQHQPWTNILHNQRKLLWEIRWRSRRDPGGHRRVCSLETNGSFTSY